MVFSTNFVAGNVRGLLLSQLRVDFEVVALPETEQSLQDSVLMLMRGEWFQWMRNAG